jgi:nicotinamide mononucleotide adenylyltransferase
VLAARLAQRFANRGGATRVDVDAFKAFHPAYTRLRAENELTADDFVHPDARRWFDMALDYLAQLGAHAIVEHGLRSWEVTDALLTRFDSSKHLIEAALLATPLPLSMLRVSERFQVSHERTGFGRDVPEDLQRARAAHLLTVADWVDADRRVAAVSVYGFNGDEVRRNEHGPDRVLQDQVPTREVIETLWRTPLDRETSEEILRLHDSLAARMDPAWAPRLATVLAEARPLLHPAAGHGPSHQKTAVTYGRYQLVSIAHLDTVRTILRDWPRVVVGVIDLNAAPAEPMTVPEHLRSYYAVSEANTSAAKNPMTLQERIGFWRAAVETAGLSDRVSVEAIARPALHPAEFNARYPAGQFDVVFPASSDGEQAHTDRAQILGRAVFAVRPALEYHTSHIRESYNNGAASWVNGLAPGTAQPFLDADGPRRLFDRQTVPADQGGVPGLRDRIKQRSRQPSEDANPQPRKDPPGPATRSPGRHM